MDQGDDHTLERLLELDGEIMVVSSDGAYWVKFEVKRVAATPARPHGLSYSLTLHGPRNERLVGFDNAHPVAPQTWGRPQDHRHVGGRAKPHAYSDAADLLSAFWAEVDRVLKERGVQ